MRKNTWINQDLGIVSKQSNILAKSSTPYVILNKSHNAIALIKNQEKLHIFNATQNGLFNWREVEVVDFKVIG